MLGHKYQFEALGTQWSIETPQPLIAKEKQQITYQIDEFDKVYSRFRDDSLVIHARKKAPGEFNFPDSIVPIFDTYTKLSKVTGGKVNPLIGESLEQLGYDQVYSLKPKSNTPSIPPSLSETVNRLDNKLIFKKPALLDIGAIGKGYIVDTLANYLSQKHDYFIVDGSGDISINTKVDQVIGLEHPLDPSRVIGLVRLKNKCLCGSAVNRRSWGEGLHHIIDAKTGNPTNSGIIATWAIAGNTMLADALSTGLFFASPDQLQQVFGDFLYVTVGTDGDIKHNIQSIGEIYT